MPPFLAIADTVSSDDTDAYVPHHASLWAIGSLPTILLYGFAFAMALHAFRERRWLWIVAMLALPFSAIWYFTSEYKKNPMRGFELPGAADRARAKRLEGEMARCDFPRPDLKLALGELRLRQGKPAEAVGLLAEAHAADPRDPDATGLYGQALLRAGRAAEAAPLLAGVVAKSPKHAYGYTRMAYAEALTALGKKEEAEECWRGVLQGYEYDRAKVQLAQLLSEKGDVAAAKALVEDVVSHARHHHSLNRKSDRVWIRRAKSLKRRMK